MKIAIIENIKEKKKFEIENIKENDFIKSFDYVSKKDIYNGFKAIKNKKEYYITIVNF